MTKPARQYPAPSLVGVTCSVGQQKLPERLPRARLAAGSVAGNLILIEDAIDRGKKPRQVRSERIVELRGLSVGKELLANQIIERAGGAETALDSPCRAALLNPDLFEPHGDIVYRHLSRPARAQWTRNIS